MTTETTGRDTPDPPQQEITADQIVAMNVRHWRKAAGITLKELGRRCGKSEANMSAIEQSASSDRERRRFDAQDLVTLSLALGVPLAALLLPPEDDGHDKRYVLETPGGKAGMDDLLGRVILFPPDDLSDLAEAWRARLNRAARKHLGTDFAEHTARLLAEDTEPDMRAEIAAMIRAEAERVQEGLNADRDHLHFLWRFAEHFEPYLSGGADAEAAS